MLDATKRLIPQYITEKTSKRGNQSNKARPNTREGFRVAIPAQLDLGGKQPLEDAREDYQALRDSPRGFEGCPAIVGHPPQIGIVSQPLTDAECPALAQRSSQVAEPPLQVTTSPSKTDAEQPPQTIANSFATPHQPLPVVETSATASPPSQTNTAQQPQENAEHSMAVRWSSQVAELSFVVTLPQETNPLRQLQSDAKRSATAEQSWGGASTPATMDILPSHTDATRQSQNDAESFLATRQPSQEVEASAMVTSVGSRSLMDTVHPETAEGSQNIKEIVTVDMKDMSADDSVIAVMGPTGCGKSTFIRIASGIDTQVISHSLKSFTNGVQAIRFRHQESGRHVVLVDTPGFDDTFKSDCKVLDMISNWLNSSHMNGKPLSGILYLHRITDNRMANASLKNLRIFQKLCGKDVLDRIYLTTTMWDVVEPSMGEGRLATLKQEYWKAMINQGAQVVCCRSDDDSPKQIIQQILDHEATSKAVLLREEMDNLRTELKDTKFCWELDSPLETIERQMILLERIDEKTGGTSGASSMLAKLQTEYNDLRAHIDDYRYRSHAQRVTRPSKAFRPLLFQRRSSTMDIKTAGQLPWMGAKHSATTVLSPHVTSGQLLHTDAKHPEAVHQSSPIAEESPAMTVSLSSQVNTALRPAKRADHSAATWLISPVMDTPLSQINAVRQPFVDEEHITIAPQTRLVAETSSMGDIHSSQIGTARIETDRASWPLTEPHATATIGDLETPNSVMGIMGPTGPAEYQDPAHPDAFPANLGAEGSVVVSTGSAECQSGTDSAHSDPYSATANTKHLEAGDTVIAIMGPTGSGKSTFVRVASGRNTHGVGHTLRSITNQVEPVRFWHHESGRYVVLVDTPGFDDTFKSNVEILDMISEWLNSSYKDGKLLSGILYFHRITDNRITDTSLGNLQVFRKLCGRDALKKVWLTTTMWDDVDPDVGKRRLRELRLECWETIIKHGAHVACCRSDDNSPKQIIQKVINHEATPDLKAVLLQKEMADLNKELKETQAGRELYSQLEGLVKRQILLLRKIDKEKKEASDPELLWRLQVEYNELRKQMGDKLRQMEKLKLSRFKALLRFFSSGD